jgi:hypothetical protein
MPVVKVENRKFIVHWLPEWDKALLRIGKKYRRTYKGLRCVRWQEAEADGALKGLPNAPRQVYSHRLSELKRRQDPKKVLKRKLWGRAYWEKHHMVAKDPERRYRMVIDMDPSDKKAIGYKSRESAEWPAERVKLLLYLVEKYRKTEITIDWNALMTDPKVKLLPKYTKAHLRSYYWSYITKKDPAVIAKRRKQALDYKKRNYKKYLKNNSNRRALVRGITNQLLLKEVKKR